MILDGLLLEDEMVKDGRGRRAEGMNGHRMMGLTMPRL